MKDWLHDDDRRVARWMGVKVGYWRRHRRVLIEHGLLRAEVHPVEGAILRFTHPEHIAAMGLLLEPRR